MDFWPMGATLEQYPHLYRFLSSWATLPLLNMLELSTCTLMLPATVSMNFQISYGNFNALRFPCCHQLFSSCFKESSKFWWQFQAVKFCKFQYASALILNAAEISTIVPPF